MVMKMTETKKTTCDGCQRFLDVTDNSVDYRLRLTCERIPSTPGAVTDMLKYPIIEKDRHYCSLGCLQKHIIHG